MTAPAVMPNAAQLAASRKRELEAIVAEHGAITPEYVLARASDEASPLHALFEWDDSEAAQKFRLVQAAMYIRGQARMYRVEGSDEPMRVRAYISLPSDRGSGTFRPLAVVLDDEQMRTEMVGDALADYEKFKAKYQHLTELDRLFAAADEEAQRIAS
jgi:hypothetical protein